MEGGSCESGGSDNDVTRVQFHQPLDSPALLAGDLGIMLGCRA